MFQIVLIFRDLDNNLVDGQVIESSDPVNTEGNILLIKSFASIIAAEMTVPLTVEHSLDKVAFIHTDQKCIGKIEVYCHEI